MDIITRDACKSRMEVTGESIRDCGSMLIDLMNHSDRSVVMFLRSIRCSLSDAISQIDDLTEQFPNVPDHESGRSPAGHDGNAGEVTHAH